MKTNKPRKLTHRMKDILSLYGLNPDNYHYISKTDRDITVLHKHSTRPRTLALNIK